MRGTKRKGEDDACRAGGGAGGSARQQVVLQRQLLVDGDRHVARARHDGGQLVQRGVLLCRAPRAGAARPVARGAVTACCHEIVAPCMTWCCSPSSPRSSSMAVSSVSCGRPPPAAAPAARLRGGAGAALRQRRNSAATQECWGAREVSGGEAAQRRTQCARRAASAAANAVARVRGAAAHACLLSSPSRAARRLRRPSICSTCDLSRCIMSRRRSCSRSLLRAPSSGSAFGAGSPSYAATPRRHARARTLRRSPRRPRARPASP